MENGSIDRGLGVMRERVKSVRDLKNLQIPEYLKRKAVNSDMKIKVILGRIYMSDDYEGFVDDFLENWVWQGVNDGNLTWQLEELWQNAPVWGLVEVKEG